MSKIQKNFKKSKIQKFSKIESKIEKNDFLTQKIQKMGELKLGIFRPLSNWESYFFAILVFLAQFLPFFCSLPRPLQGRPSGTIVSSWTHQVQNCPLNRMRPLRAPEYLNWARYRQNEFFGPIFDFRFGAPQGPFEKIFLNALYHRLPLHHIYILVLSAFDQEKGKAVFSRFQCFGLIKKIFS